jgi:hypothetical protein
MRRLRPLLLLLALAPAGCGMLGPGPDDGGRAALARARQEWAAAGWDAYRLAFVRSCECLPEMAGPFEVTVEDARIVSATREGEPVEPGAAVLYTVEGLFGLVEDAYDRGAPTVRVTYTPGLGVPERVFVDYDERMADEEAVVDVLHLARLRP